MNFTLPCNTESTSSKGLLRVTRRVKCFEGVRNEDSEQKCDGCQLPLETLGQEHERQKGGDCVMD
jgi:hypothetical protein